jgi:hypothetical protein
MKSSHIITLFGESPPPRRGPSSFVVSILVHGAGFGLLAHSLRHIPRIEDKAALQRYTVRLLNPRKTESQARQSAGNGLNYHGMQAIAHADAPVGRVAQLPYVTAHDTRLISASQTLVQPDAPPDLLLPHEVPLPVVVIWSPDNAPSKTIVLPEPQPASVADVLPSLALPNHEPDLADLEISATVFATETPEIPSSTTVPLVIRGPELVKQIPMTAAEPLEQPTPARVVSLSDVQVQGAVEIPLANASLQAFPSEQPALGRPGKSSEEGSGSLDNKQMGIGAGKISGDRRDKAITGVGSVSQNDANAGLGQPSHPDARAGAGPGAGLGVGLDDESSVTRITLPKNGQFGVVVVGSSLAEQYPETVEVWRGRLVYTVYLHVGLGKSWILQYSVPRAEEAAEAGSITRPEAPWPYEIVRPHLAASDYNSDAILVHGFVNPAGRFEHLAIVFPPEFAQSKFLLTALQQWQFRPALQNGQIAAVEILLIIPEETQ